MRQILLVLARFQFLASSRRAPRSAVFQISCGHIHGCRSFFICSRFREHRAEESNQAKRLATLLH